MVEYVCLEDLERQIRERKDTIKRYIQFIVDITLKKGVIVDERVGSSNIRIVRRLENFGGFTFLADIGQTMMGGEEYKILLPGHGDIVFSVRCQGGTILEVDVFPSEWCQWDIENLIDRCEEEEAEEINQGDSYRAQKEERWQRRMEEKKKLVEEAVRLKL